MLPYTLLFHALYTKTLLFVFKTINFSVRGIMGGKFLYVYPPFLPHPNPHFQTSSVFFLQCLFHVISFLSEELTFNISHSLGMQLPDYLILTANIVVLPPF